MLKPLPFDFKMGLVFMVVLEQLDIYSVRLNVPLGEGSFRVICAICASRRNSINNTFIVTVCPNAGTSTSARQRENMGNPARCLREIKARISFNC